MDAGIGPAKSDIKVLNEGKMLLDTHFFAAHKLIQKQFHLDGCQSTLLYMPKQWVFHCLWKSIYLI